jgi:hypothetical protein
MTGSMPKIERAKKVTMTAIAANSGVVQRQRASVGRSTAVIGQTLPGS